MSGSGNGLAPVYTWLKYKFWPISVFSANSDGPLPSGYRSLSKSCSHDSGTTGSGRI